MSRWSLPQGDSESPDLLGMRETLVRHIVNDERALLLLRHRTMRLSIVDIIYEIRVRASFFGVFQIFEKVKRLQRKVQRLEELEDENKVLKLKLQKILNDRL